MRWLKDLEQAPAMPRAQRHAEAAQNLGAQHLAVPRIRRVSQFARAIPEREFEFPHVRIGEHRMPPGMGLFPQPFDADDRTLL